MLVYKHHRRYESDAVLAELTEVVAFSVNCGGVKTCIHD